LDALYRKGKGKGKGKNTFRDKGKGKGYGGGGGRGKGYGQQQQQQQGPGGKGRDGPTNLHCSWCHVKRPPGAQLSQARGRRASQAWAYASGR
jgi:hypothetical protein